MSFFHFLKFVMNFSKGVVSICHSFRSTGHLGRINGFVDRYTQQHSVDFLKSPSSCLFSTSRSLGRFAANIFNPEIHEVVL